MRGMMLWGVVMSMALGSAAQAQRLGPEPRRKRSSFVADTNDAMALYDWALARVERDAGAAADAFYWAARINPAYAEPLYGLRAAILLRDPGLLQRRMNVGRRGPSREVRQVDSLLLRALMINPFLYQRLDRLLLITYIRNETQRGMTASDPEAHPGRLDFAIEAYLRAAGPEIKGWLAYSDGDFNGALAFYRDVERAAREKAPIRIDRARIFGMQGQVDSAVAAFQGALTELREKEDKDLVYLYNSKAMLEHSVATLLEGQDDVDGAREAYGRALEEDLAFYPAHVRLGLLALGKGDTTTALSELSLAAQVAGDEPWVRFTYGFALAVTQQVDRAIEELTKATQLEPLYAMPHAILGQLWEQKADAPRALAAYEAFLARASRRDPQREKVNVRLEEVRAYIRPRS